MKSKKIWANFSVKDANRTREFYTSLGFSPNGPDKDPKLTGFLFGDDGFIILFFEEGSQIDEYLPAGQKNNSEIIFTLSAESEKEIKEWEEKVKAAGGNIFHPAGRDKTNHYGFAFTDPDGHKFNVLLMKKDM